MKTRNKILFVGLLFTTFACSTKEAEKKSTEKESVKEEVPVETETQEMVESQTLELNNGEKWSVNPEMAPFIQSTQELVQNFKIDAKSNYKGLAAQLKKGNSKLVASCTMIGKGHDELHKWLVPHLELVDQLENSGEEEAKEVVEKLKASFDLLNQYFQVD